MARKKDKAGIRKAKRLRDEGKTVAEIAEEVGHSKGWVYLALRTSTPTKVKEEAEAVAAKVDRGIEMGERTPITEAPPPVVPEVAPVPVPVAVAPDVFSQAPAVQERAVPAAAPPVPAAVPEPAPVAPTPSLAAQERVQPPSPKPAPPTTEEKRAALKTLALYHMGLFVDRATLKAARPLEDVRFVNGRRLLAIQEAMKAENAKIEDVEPYVDRALDEFYDGMTV